MSIKGILTVAVVIVSFSAPALADYYPSTLSAEERERHEFLDVQRGNYPTGPAPFTLPSQSLQKKTLGSPAQGNANM